MTILQSIAAALNWHIRVNENFSAVSPAGLFAKKDSATTGLTLGYYGGILDGVSYADGTHLLTASTTRYVVAERSTGTVSSATGTTNWDNQTDYLRMGVAVVGASTITTWTDWREAYAAGSSGTVDWANLTSVPATVDDIATLVDPNADRLLFWDDSAGALVYLTLGTGLSITGTTINASGGAGDPQCIPIACSDETTALTAGTAKVTFRMPFAFTLSEVRASVTTAPTGSVLTVDINESGASILSTKLTIDATEKTSTTAATPAVISDANLADDAEITIDIDGVGSTIAGAGLKVYLIGTP